MLVFYALIGCAAMQIMRGSYGKAIFLVNENVNGV